LNQLKSLELVLLLWKRKEQSFVVRSTEKVLHLEESEELALPHGRTKLVFNWGRLYTSTGSKFQKSVVLAQKQ
jgi:hypothetical protein